MRPQPMHVDDLPPLAVPLRFYLTAPGFGVAAAVLLALDPTAWSTRWHPATFAAVHLLALGVVSMVMVGSLFQVIPVLGGRAVARAQRVGAWVHACLTLGSALIAAAFVRPDWGLWPPVLVLVGLGFAVFVVAAGAAVAGTKGAGDSIFVIRLAMLALCVTVAIGAYLAAARVWPDAFPRGVWLTHVHLAWALGGWVALLVMAVSFQILPMFQVAPAFHSRWARGTAGAVLGALVTMLLSQHPVAVTLAMTALCSGLIAYAVHALSVIARRRRRRADALQVFWKTSLGSLILGALLAWVLVCTPLHATQWASRCEVILGVLIVFGFVLSVMIGMVVKITAFLAFLHLQRRCLLDVSVATLLPTMDQFVTERAQRILLRVHAATCIAALVAAGWPPFGRVAAGLMVADFGVLFVLLSIAARRYHQASTGIELALAGREWSGSPSPKRS